MPTTNDTEYIPRDDESEAKRYKDVAGIGEVNYMDDEQVRSYAISDFDFNFDEHK